jgi:photoactive yellow protein
MIPSAPLTLEQETSNVAAATGALRLNGLCEVVRATTSKGDTMLEFNHISLATLSSSTQATLDDLPYGVIGLSTDGLVRIYNATESKLAGLPAIKVVGGNFFNNIAQCMNNFMVAQRFIDEPEIDTTIDFVLTLRMRRTPVKLRLLQGKAAALHFILIHRVS